MLRRMEAVRIGLSIRALRRRRGWSQAQLGGHAGCSASRISRVERGAVVSITLGQLESILAALGARLSVRVLWQGEELDRLLDRDHARIVEAVLRLLATLGWITVPEVTFHIDRERGSIDILAWHPHSSTLLVVEVKSVVPDVQATLSGVDRKARVAPRIAHDRGWQVASVARLLVLPDQRTARRRVEAFSTTFNRAFPARTVEIKRWLAAPDGPLAGILFLSALQPTQPRQRVRAATSQITHGSVLRS
jgi:transcriptional regulator with XRE-family HTH domain